MLQKLSLAIVLCSFSAVAQSQVPFMGMGDSLGEGDQSANAFSDTQEADYLNLVAQQMGLNNQQWVQPLLTTSAFAYTNIASGRSRININVDPTDIAVSGAKVNDVLTSVASTPPHREVDLVLPPYYGMSQIQIAEQVKPKLIFCWIGSNDLIGYVINYTRLTQPKYTPIDQFQSGIQELFSRLAATGAQVVVGNIPDLTKIGFLFNNADLQKYLGTDYNFPDGYLTTLPVMLFLKNGTYTSSKLQDPNYILTPAQITNIQNQVNLYNEIIATTAAQYGFPIADCHAVVDNYITHPTTMEGITVSTHFNGGAFSLDGIHPSNSGYAVFANEFIQAANATYHLNIPVLTTDQLTTIFNADPYIDFNGNGVVKGRPFKGLWETLCDLIGVGGDLTDVPPTGQFRTPPQISQNPNTANPNWSRALITRGVIEVMNGLQ